MITEALMEIPKGHHIFGTVKVGERGQIIIPKEARELFGLVLRSGEYGIHVRYS